MKRHPALIPLTHDHHHGLKHARRLKLATKQDESERTHTAEEFLDFFRSEALIHFREEEELLFPALLEHDSGAEDAIGGLLLDHVRMHGFAARLERERMSGSVSADTMTAAGTLLERHIRVEENEVFRFAQEAIPEDELQTLAFAPRDRSG
ncbi:MAG TPA: hemerythrin domain-containing protein [Actinomycetota bacterium]|nr:hemerythrin domain-containing protein [Actinomycetota bacterium]